MARPGGTDNTSARRKSRQIPRPELRWPGDFPASSRGQVGRPASTQCQYVERVKRSEAGASSRDSIDTLDG